MNHCIYFNNSDSNLSFTKQEHVLPAGLGGIAKLPCGYVSDEANETFSRYEMQAMRHSLLSVNRDNNGPGKRGSFCIRRVRDPVINIFDAVYPEAELDTLLVPFRLGFLFTGKVQILPQIYFRFDEKWNMKLPLYVADNYSRHPESALSNFRLMFSQFLPNKHRKYIFIELPKKTTIKFVSIGYYNKKFFVCSSIHPFRMDALANLLQLRPLPEFTLYSSISNYHYRRTLNDINDSAFPMLYIKTALNVLAFIKGHSFILKSVFDPIRSSVLYVKNLDQFWIPRVIPKWLIEWVMLNVPPKAHFVVIHANGNTIDAYVSFYREPLTSTIQLTSNYSGRDFKFGMVCDWQSHKEQQFLSID